jgi:hypothetical protein
MFPWHCAMRGQTVQLDRDGFAELGSIGGLAGRPRCHRNVARPTPDSLEPFE